MTQVFRVKTEWLRTCGYPEHPNDFPVTRIDPTYNGLTPVHVDTPFGPWVCIAPWRGEIVENEQLKAEDSAA